MKTAQAYVRIMACAAVVLIPWLRAGAQTHPFGMGVIVGEPCGITMKVWFNSYIAMDIAAGADFGPPSQRLFLYDLPPSFQTHLEFLLHVPLLRTRSLRLPLYAGAGAKLNWRAGFQGVRARTPIGLALLLPRKPWHWELFCEFAPTWGAHPQNFDPDAAMGFRYYF